MKRTVALLLMAMSLIFLGACGDDDGDGPTAAGGEQGAGGQMATGGEMAVGGERDAGGEINAGGVEAAGGAPTGGETGEGGAMAPPNIEALDNGSYVCRPAGEGPFPGVLYNHGGRGTAVGGDLEGTCRAFAERGYIARSQKRPEENSLMGQLDSALEGLDALRTEPTVDVDRIGVIGFSRGGLLTLQTLITRADQLHAAVICAPAPANGALERTLMNVDAVSAPVHVMVSENDQQSMGDDVVDHVALSTSVYDALDSAGKVVEFSIYPPFETDGHRLFFEVRNPWWSDAVSFFDRHLQP